jgi:hypothetical protein
MKLDTPDSISALSPSRGLSVERWQRIGERRHDTAQRSARRVQSLAMPLVEVAHAIFDGRKYPSILGMGRWSAQA